MHILSLFDGISCAHVALERAGIPITTYHASEVDKYAIQISKKNHPDIVHVGDVQSIHRMWGRVDLLIGGSPCQDLSIAKKDRKGLDGERSGLFWEYVRILQEVKPKYFILENVASMPKEAKDIITTALGVEPIMINASLVSAQTRKRLFWTNIPNVTQPEDRGIVLADILETDVDEKYFIAEKTLDSIASWGKAQAGRIRGVEGKSVTLQACGGGTGAKTGLYVVPVALRNRGEGKKPEYNGTEKANAMTTVQTDSMVEEHGRIRKLTPVECERLQGLPDNYTEGVSNTQRYKMLGNAFNVDVVAHILSFIPR
jgi:DNA-cytosine methyltransferase